MEKKTDKELYIETLTEQQDKLHDLKALYDTPGGKHLVSLYMTDVAGIVHQLCNGYKDMDLTKLHALCAEMNVHLTTARLLMNAKESEETIKQQLEEALAE